MSLGLVIGQKAKEWTSSLSFSLIWGTPIHYRNAGFRRFIFICRAGHQTQGHKHATQVGLDYIPTQGFTLGVYVLIVCVYMYSVYLCTRTCVSSSAILLLVLWMQGLSSDPELTY